MLYNNICKSPPTTDRPATISLIPYDAAAPFVLVALALEPVPVPVVDEDPSRVLVVSVVLQMKVP